MQRLCLIWLGALCLARPVYAMSLPELEADLEQALPVLIAEAEVQRSQAVRNQRDAEQGWKFLGGAGLSNDILPTSEDGTTSGTSSVPTSVPGASSVVSAGTSTFQRLTGRVGVRYPLWGSRLTEKLALLAAEAQVDVSTAKKQIAKLDAQFALRRRYINYWGAQRKIELTKAFLDLEAPVEAVLTERKQAGLLLESDRLEFLTAFSLARRNLAKLEAIQEASRMSLNVLTKQDLESFAAEYPKFPIPCLNDQQLARRIVDHPEMQLYRRIVSEKADGLQFAGHRSIESGLSISQDIYRQFPNDENGYNSYVGIDVRMPIDFLDTDRSYRDQASAALTMARLELDLRGRELRAQASQFLNAYRARRENLQFAAKRLLAAEEAVRERRLRAQRLPGDVLEKLQQARLAYYHAASDAIEAEALLLDGRAHVLAVVPEACGPASSEVTGPRVELAVFRGQEGGRAGRMTMGGVARTRGTEPSGDYAVAADGSGKPAGVVKLGTYIWNAGPLLKKADDTDDVWRQFATRGIRRALVSFTATEIDALSERTAQDRLRRFIKSAKSREIRIDLLLGEPTWILPRHRGDLLSVIRKLRSIPFAALNLDLEPNQLDERALGKEYLLKELLATLASVKSISPWPIALSVHPRYLKERIGAVELGKRLADLELDEITLMVYVRNPDRTAEILTPILKAYPEVKFSVAQSIEDTLPREESHFSAGFAELQRRMRRLAKSLPQPNFNGIIVQAWSYFDAMHP